MAWRDARSEPPPQPHAWASSAPHGAEDAGPRLPAIETAGAPVSAENKWVDVRTDSAFLERSKRRKPGALRAQEKYLRRDVPCGFARCPACAEAGADAGGRRDLQPRLGREQAEVVVPDAVGLLQCMELIEEPLFARAAPQLLVLQSVWLKALRMAPARDAARLRNFFRDDRRRANTDCRVYWFPDQHHADTAVDSKLRASSGQSVAVELEQLDARDDRAVLQTLTWYAAHGHLDKSTRVVFMARDVDAPLSVQVVAAIRDVSACDATATTCETFLEERLRPLEGRQRSYDDDGVTVDFLLELAVNTAEAVEWWVAQREAAEDGGSVLVSSEFAPHWSLAKVRQSVENGQVLSGRLEVSTHNPMEAFVGVQKTSSLLPGVDKVFVFGREAMNRGVHGDEVVIEILPRSQWRAPQSDRLLVHFAADDDEREDGEKHKAKHKDGRDADGEDADAAVHSHSIPTGRVVAVLARSPRYHVATVLAASVSPTDDVALAIPMDARIPKIRVRSQRMDALADKRLKVVIDHWPLDSQYPQGHYVGIIGAPGRLSTELSALLVQNDIEEAPFSEGALACLPECDIERYSIAECSTAKRPQFCPLLDWQVPADEAARRLDLSATRRVFSVDPPGCQDIDDAMSIQRLPNGNFELGVHIADVSHFVTHESRLDFEARSRATTVYLVGQRLDMLPSVLSADLCSLHENVDRLAVSVLWEVDSKSLQICHNGKPTWFGRTVIRSCSSMTYEQAHRLLQGATADKPRESHRGPKDVDAPHQVGVAGGPIPLALQHELSGDLTLLTDIARKLARTRGEHGGLDLSKHEELRFSLNVTELGAEGVEIMVKESLEIHNTIAELMILANGSVATQIIETFPSHALLRRHPPPSGDRFAQLVKLAKTRDIAIDATNNYTLQQSLSAAERSGNVDSKTMALLKSLAIRVMTEAEYVCTSSVEAPGMAGSLASSGETRFAHYGLGLQYYTHFTSPIRRYADVIVHRQLLASQVFRPTSQGQHLAKPRNVKSVPSLPQSVTPSVLDDDEDFLDDLISSVDSKLQVESPQEAHRSGDPAEEELAAAAPFPPDELVPLAAHLNKKNRNAKLASRACDELFLALYFSTHTVKAPAIITALKANGFIVYIPLYDVRAPVYIRDKDGNVQMDPLLLGVRIVDTLPATGAFSNAECIRMVPQAEIDWEPESDSDTLHVRVSGASPAASGTAFKILDEIEVQVSCDLSASAARIPQLQLLMVGRARGRRGKVVTKSGGSTVTSSPKPSGSKSLLPEVQRVVQTTSREQLERDGDDAQRLVSPPLSPPPPPRNLYCALTSWSSEPVSPAIKTKKKKGKKQADEVPAAKRLGNSGRLLFGGYNPPKQKHYQQKLAHYMGTRSEELEAELSIFRGGGGESAWENAQTAKQIEREAMSRAQRLAAEKRHDRINKRNKAGR